MPKFEGCIQAREISLCPIELGGGANPKAHALVLKSMAAPAATQPENTPMPTEAEKAAAAAQTAAINKAALLQTTAIAAMSDVTKAHFLGLGDPDAQLAFLAKSADEQKAEAEAAKAAADKKALEEEALKSGTTPQVLELMKSNSDLRAEVEALKAKQVDADLEKRAATEFDGFPGGVAAVVPLLKAYAKLDEPARKVSEDMLKAQAAAAKGMTKVFGGRTEEEVSKQAGAQQRINEAVEKYAGENKVSKEIALQKVSELPQFADDVKAAFG
jgi:hypothetical protein